MPEFGNRKLLMKLCSFNPPARWLAGGIFHVRKREAALPHRFDHLAERFAAMIVALYEPLAYYAAALGAATVSAVSPPDSMVAGVDGPWMELFGYALGTIADLHARGRVYAKLPYEERASRLREWKERLGLAAIGLGLGVLLSGAINGFALVWQPAIAPAFYPVVNFFAVLIAVPMIDGVRGVMRVLSGRSSQEAFAGLVIGWARKRSGQRGGGTGGEGGGHA